MIDILNDFLRVLFWMITQVALNFTNTIYEIMLDVMSVNIGEYGQIWSIYWLLIGFVMAFVIFRVIKLLISNSFNEERKGNWNPLSTIVRIGMIAVVIVLTPFIIRVISYAASELINGIGAFFGSEADMTPARLILQLANQVGEGGELVFSEISTIDINAKGPEGYLYFPTWVSLATVLLVSVMCCYLMIIISVQAAARILGIGYSIMISFYPISSLVDERDDSFKNWSRLLFADIAGNFFQYLMLLLVMMFCTSEFIQSQGGVVQIFFLIGAFVMTLTAPNKLASIIGVDIGIASTMQGIHQTMAMGHALSGTSKVVGGALSFAGAGATYTVGRMAGGGSLLNGIDNNSRDGLNHSASAMGNIGAVASSTSNATRNSSSNFNNSSIYSNSNMNESSYGNTSSYGYGGSTATSSGHQNVDPSGNIYAGMSGGIVEPSGSLYSGQNSSKETLRGNTTGGNENGKKLTGLAAAASNYSHGQSQGRLDGFSRGVVRFGGSMASMMYQSSAQRLGRSVRTSNGQRNSRIVQASHVVHNAGYALQNKTGVVRNQINQSFIAPTAGSRRK